MSSVILKRIYNISIYVIGTCVLLAAIFATLVRVFLPDVGMYRSEVEAWVSNYMELPVVIHAIKADWDGWTPRLYLEKIDLLDSTGTDPIIYFNTAEISIDLYNSLLNRQITPTQLIISGLEMSVSRLNDGSINIEGIKVRNDQQIDNSSDDLEKWFLNQSVIELQNANIIWLDAQHNQPSVKLTNVNLILKSDGDRLQVEGNTSLPDEYGEDMNFAIDISGNILSSNWSAELFFKANKIVPDKWYKKYWPKELIISGGNASISLWSTLIDTKIHSFYGKLEYKDLSLFSNNTQTLAIENLITNFSGDYQSTDTWLFNINIEELITQYGSWPTSNISLLAKDINNRQNTYLDINFNYIKLIDISKVAIAIPDLSDFVIKHLTDNEISGELIDGNFGYKANGHPEEKFHYNLKFRGIDTAFLEIEPNLSELSGSISGNEYNGNVNFKDDHVQINHINGHDPVKLNGVISWDRTDNIYSLNTNGLIIENEKIKSHLSGAFKKSTDKSFIDIIIDINGEEIQDLIMYMPYTANFRAREWIQRSITTGKLSSFKLILRGEPANFPFDDNKGQFIASAEINDARLLYSQNFPPIDNINAKLQFNGRKLDLEIENGTIYKSSITKANAHISNLFSIQKLLAIDGKINSNTIDLKNFITNSPLKNNLMLEKINKILSPTGNIHLDLELKIPIRNPDQKLIVAGELEIENSKIVSDLNNIELTDLNGKIHFTQTSIASEEMSAKLNGQNVTLSANGSNNINNEPASITITGIADNNFISNQIDLHFANLSHFSKLLKQKLSGSTAWEANLLYSKNKSGDGIARILNISSNMIGMAVDLPEPLAKKDYESITFEIIKDLDADINSNTTLKYDDITTEFKSQSYSKSKLHSINVLIGDTNAVINNLPGINFAGNLQYLNINDWLKILPKQSKSDKISESLQINANITIDKLDYLGQTFPNSSVIAENNLRDWKFSISSPKIDGDILLSNIDEKNNHLIANLKTLILETSTGENKNNTNPALLPSMLVKIDTFKYDDKDLGALSLTAVPTNNGLLIEDISFVKQNLYIKANGKWNNNRYTGSASNFYIDVHADEFKQILDTFGFNNDFITKSETKLIIDANWPGSPTNFSLEKLNGTIKLNMDKGSLTEIQPAAGRLFGLLSLQALPRRLVLDFSDLFGAGMAFDSISGSFNINDGNAYTDDLSMKGPSVDIDIHGRTGLSDKDYDQTAIITPQISDSLAVASGFLGPVGIGMGTVLYLASNMFEKLQDSINKIIKIKYYIKGRWDNPIVERANSKSDS